MREPTDRVAQVLNKKLSAEEMLEEALAILAKLPMDDQIILILYLTQQLPALTEKQLFVKWCNSTAASVDDIPIKRINEI